MTCWLFLRVKGLNNAATLLYNYLQCNILIPLILYVLCTYVQKFYIIPQVNKGPYFVNWQMALWCPYKHNIFIFENYAETGRKMAITRK
jgi:hypothetical protein